MTTEPMTDPGIAELGIQEGTILKWYRDATGTWTCCTGHTSAAGEPIYPRGTPFTKASAAAILSADLMRIYLPGVDHALRRQPLPHQRDAFGSFAYNAGVGTFLRSEMLTHFNAGDDAAAAEAFLDYTRSKGAVLPGLVKRRRVECVMFLHGIYPGVAVAPEDTTAGMNDAHMIGKGATGRDVVELQRQLTAAGFSVKSDGNFGAATDGAVRAFQSARGLPVDGVVGLKTWMAIERATSMPSRPVPTYVPPSPRPPDAPTPAKPAPAAPRPWWKFW